ncbi:MAG TPA: PTS sugar transporter subunit IIA, partial [bacterium]|nr:PTS sugar transporter subunit IIA [bacterium]
VSRDRDGAIAELASALAARTGGRVAAAVIEKGLLERERDRATALGNGIAIPHAKAPGLDDVVGVLGRSRGGIEWGAPDGPCKLIFALVAPEARPAQHLKALALVSRLMRTPTARESVLLAATAADALDALRHADAQG